MKQLKGKTPPIRFSEFTNLWEYKKLNCLLRVSNSKNKKLEYGKDDVLSVSGELGILNQIEYLGRSYAGASVHNYGIVETGNIVYTKSPLKSNPYGIIKINMGKSGIVSTLYAVYEVIESNADGRFLDHYFSLDANTNRYLRPLVRKGAKNDMKISNAYVLNDSIYVPSLQEQKKVADFFDVLNKKLEQLKKKKTLLIKYKKGLVQQIFKQEIRFKKEDGTSFPDWEEKALGDVGQIISGLTYKPSDIDKKGVLVLRSSNIRKRRLSFEDNVFVKSDSYNPVKENDILICVRNGSKNLIGKNALIDKKYEGLAFGAFMTVFRSPFNRYIFQVFETQRYKKNIHRNLGATINSINGKDLRKFKIPFPSLLEQKTIAEFLEEIDEKLKITDHQIKKTKEYKKGLLQQMFAV